MPDEWSSSVATLAGRGDWIKWDFTIPDSQAADDFNGDPNFSRMAMAIRLALTAASRHAYIYVIVNDTIVMAMSGSTANSSSGWVSADRFAIDERSVTPGFIPIDADFGFLTSIPDIAPFVVGTNTIRLLSLGRVSDHANEAIEIDFMYLATGTPTPDVTSNFAAIGSDSAAESPPSAFATHVNGTPFTTDDHGWLLKAPDGTTGTAAIPKLRMLKFCPSGGGNITAILRVDANHVPLSGFIGFRDRTLATTTTTTLDGAGMATFIFPDTSDVTFWYGGNDDWMPVAVAINDGFRIGCDNGWHIGRIGVGR